MKIYVASSWKNNFQQSLINALESEGYEVYDFRNPVGRDQGFHWSDVDPTFDQWTVQDFRMELTHPLAEKGFKIDMNALRNCDVCLLLMDCGRSAHIELGYAIGAGKKSIIFILQETYKYPELMWKMADMVCITIEEVLDSLNTFRENLAYEEQMQQEIVKAGKCPTCGRQLEVVMINGKDTLMCSLCQTPLEIPEEYFEGLEEESGLEVGEDLGKDVLPTKFREWTQDCPVCHKPITLEVELREIVLKEGLLRPNIQATYDGHEECFEGPLDFSIGADWDVNLDDATDVEIGEDGEIIPHGDLQHPKGMHYETGEQVPQLQEEAPLEGQEEYLDNEMDGNETVWHILDGKLTLCQDNEEEWHFGMGAQIDQINDETNFDHICPNCMNQYTKNNALEQDINKVIDDLACGYWQDDGTESGRCNYEGSSCTKQDSGECPLDPVEEEDDDILFLNTNTMTVTGEGSTETTVTGTPMEEEELVDEEEEPNVDEEEEEEEIDEEEKET